MLQIILRNFPLEQGFIFKHFPLEKGSKQNEAPLQYNISDIL